MMKTYCMMFELFICLYVFKCIYIDHSFRGNAAQFFSGFFLLKCYVNTLTVFIINE